MPYTGKGGIKISTTMKGPFFELKGRPLKDAGAATIQQLLREGKAKVVSQLYPGHGQVSGDYRRAVHEIFERRSKNVMGYGKISGVIDRHTSIVGAWLETGTYRGVPGSRGFKGYHMWKKTGQHLNRIVREMAGRHYKKAVQRLTM